MTTPAGAYGNLGKKAKAVLKTGSTKKPVEVQVNTKAKSNLKFKAYTDRKDGSLTLQLLPTFQHKRKNYELSFSSMIPDQQYTLRGSWKPPVEGLQFKSSINFGNPNLKKKKKTAQGTFFVGSIYTSTVYTASASFKAPQLLFGNDSVKGSRPTLTINGTYKFGYLTFGAFVENKFIHDESNNQFQIQVSKLATAFDYSRDGTCVFVSLVKESSLQKEGKFVASLNFYKKVTDDLEFGSEVSTESIFGGAKISFGGVWAVDPLSTLRAKINNEGHLGLSFRHKLNSSLTVTASADLNTITAVGYKFGLHFNYLF